MEKRKVGPKGISSVEEELKQLEVLIQGLKIPDDEAARLREEVKQKWLSGERVKQNGSR